MGSSGSLILHICNRKWKAAQLTPSPSACTSVLLQGAPRVPGTGLNIVCMTGTDLSSYFLHIRHRICFFSDSTSSLFLLLEIWSSFPLPQEDTTGTQRCLFTRVPDEMAGQDLHPKKASVQATLISMAGGFGAQAFLPRMPL